VSTRTAQGNRTAKGKADGLLRIFLLTVLFAAVGANPAVAQVQLPTVNLGDTNFEDGSAHRAGSWKEDVCAYRLPTNRKTT